MTKLPRSLSGDEVVRALGRAGFSIKRRKGSHIVLKKGKPIHPSGGTEPQEH